MTAAARSLLAWLALAALPGLALAQPAPPVAKQVPYEVKSPQGSRIDEYYWLRDDDPKAKRPEVLAHLRAEQAYTDAMMAPHAALRAKLLAEMRARIRDDDSTAPRWDNGWWYWQRYQPGAEYPQHLRRRGTPQAMAADAPEELLLDLPQLAAGKPHYVIGGYAVSPDNRLLAFVEDTQGRRMYTLRIRDLATGEFLPDAVPGALETIVWAADSNTVFYIRQDPQTLQSGPVYRHTVGTPAAHDVLVYDEPDKTLFTWLLPSASREFVRIAIVGFRTTELRVVPTREPAAPARVVLPRRDGVLAYPDHLHGRWVMRTNDSARNFRLVEAADPADRASWKELVPHRDSEALDDFALFDNAIVLQERAAANARLRVLPWGPAARGSEFVVAADEPAFAMQLERSQHPAAGAARYTYRSQVQPDSVFDVDLGSGARTLRKVADVPTYDPRRYRSARLWAPSRDGKRIPVSIAWRADRYRRDGSAPLLLNGYGSYGFSNDPRLRSGAVSLMDRGFALAIAHVRGGSELGRDWYEDGRLLHKQNTFNDFIDVTRFLVRERWTAREKVFAEGGSAGGLLMGAVANQAGSLYRAIVLHVPFVDAVTTMLDDSIPLTVNEWSQWGDPRLPGVYPYMLAYSPYDNIARRPYPAMLVTTGLWDPQVQYYEPAKYVARLRARKTDRNPLLFHINFDAGHSGRSGRFAELEERALQYAFMLSLLGVRE